MDVYYLVQILGLTLIHCWVLEAETVLWIYWIDVNIALEKNVFALV